MYRIKEIETNVIYDDVYTSIEEARQTINEYVADDGDERNITYVILDSDNEIAVSTIPELLEKHNLTMADIANTHSIPYRTVQHWNYGTRQCPTYLITLLDYYYKNESTH